MAVLLTSVLALARVCRLAVVAVTREDARAGTWGALSSAVEQWSAADASTGAGPVSCASRPAEPDVAGWVVRCRDGEDGTTVWFEAVTIVGRGLGDADERAAVAVVPPIGAGATP